MTRRIAITLLLSLALSVAASAEEIRGAWTAEANDTVAGRLHMQMNRRHSNFGQTMNVASFSGLSEAQINAATQTPVKFALRREAGTIDYEGTFKAGFGAGQFNFTANPAYLDAVRSLGVSVEPTKERRREKSMDERLMMYAINDVSTNFIRSMIAEGYRVSLDDYFKFRLFHVTPELVRELAGLGYRDIPADKLVASQIHRVTPEFIREIREAGYPDLDLKRLTEFRIHRVTPEFIRELRAAGYDNIPARKLVEMKIHGVDAEFVKKMNGM